MEKKLTDEEILKSLDYCANGGNCQKGECVFANHEEYGKKHWCLGYACESALDLIHRLQAENERLKDEKYQVEQNLKQCENGYKLELHTARFDMCMNREKVETLQKQVDELKKELEKAYEIERANIQAEIAEAGTSCQWCKNVNVKDTAKEIIAFVEEKDKKAGKYSIYRTLLQELKEKYEVE